MYILIYTLTKIIYIFFTFIYTFFVVVFKTKKYLLNKLDLTKKKLSNAVV